MVIAVIKTGGKQYKVKVGDVIKVEKLEQKESKTWEFDDLLNNRKIKVQVLEQGKNKKIRVFKYKNKTGYRRTYGHRQPYSKLKIESIR